MSLFPDVVQDLIRAGREAQAAGLMVATSGNISARVDEGRFAISASGSRLGDLSSDRIAFCSLGDDSWEGAKPSLETPFHRSIYRVRPDVGAVLHFQSPWATLMACAENPSFELDFIPEIPAYIERIGIVPYFHPGTPELANAVATEAKQDGCQMLVLTNHGQIAVGKDLDTVIRNATIFEFACSIAGRGVALRLYDRETRETLRRYGSPPSDPS